MECNLTLSLEILKIVKSYRLYYLLKIVIGIKKTGLKLAVKLLTKLARVTKQIKERLKIENSVLT